MSWGALNNQRERTSTEPLPEFLTGHGGKNFHDRPDPQFQNVEDVVVRKQERSNYTSRQESNRGYGVAYSGSINIQLSKKTFFLSIVFFVVLILSTFCVGYAIGNLSISISGGQVETNSSIKKPIIPSRKKIKQDVRSMKKNVEVVASETVSEAQEENTSHISSENNNKENDSETIDDAPGAAADTSDVVD